MSLEKENGWNCDHKCISVVTRRREEKRKETKTVIDSFNNESSQISSKNNAVHKTETLGTARRKTSSIAWPFRCRLGFSVLLFLDLPLKKNLHSPVPFFVTERVGEKEREMWHSWLLLPLLLKVLTMLKPVLIIQSADLYCT